MRKAWPSTPRLAKRKQRLPRGLFPQHNQGRVVGQAKSEHVVDFAELGSALHAVVRHDSPAHRPRCSAGRLHSRREMMARMMPELIDVEALKEQEKKRRSVIFLEVHPDMATEEEPEEADHYSNKNSQAADKQEEKDTNKPKVEGRMRRAIASSTIRPLPNPSRPSPSRRNSPSPWKNQNQPMNPNPSRSRPSLSTPFRPSRSPSRNRRLNPSPSRNPDGRTPSPRPGNWPCWPVTK